MLNPLILSYSIVPNKHRHRILKCRPSPPPATRKKTWVLGTGIRYILHCIYIYMYNIYIYIYISIYYVLAL